MLNAPSCWDKGVDVSGVYRLARSMTLICACKNDHELAKKWLAEMHACISGKNTYFSNNSCGGCTCSIAEYLGAIANQFGYYNLVLHFGRNTVCPKSAGGYKNPFTDIRLSPDVSLAINLSDSNEVEKLLDIAKHSLEYSNGTAIRAILNI